MHLYMFYIGGNAGKSNIEVHDIQFAAVNKPEDAWPLLREVWFGDKDAIHLDGYVPITWIDGYDITLSTQPYTGQKKLFFVNAGAYRPDSLAEQHAFDLFVADNATEAKNKGLKVLLKGLDQQHKDDLKEVDNCLFLDKVGGYYLHLTENPKGQRSQPEFQGYLPIHANQ